LASKHYGVGDISAALASGSFRSMGMIIAPCTVRTLSEIATGVTDNLLTRAADVALKERRRLVLLVREFPLHAGHLRSMLAVTDMGGVIAPPVPAFYTRPQTINDIVDQTVGRVLDLFDLETTTFPRWGDEISLLSAPTHGAALRQCARASVSAGGAYVEPMSCTTTAATQANLRAPSSQ
jgi:flavin prenyltransferase